MSGNNEQIIYEYVLLSKTENEISKRLVTEEGYEFYNNNLHKIYESLRKEYASVLGVLNLQTFEEVVSVCRNMKLTAEQKKDIKNIQRNPVFKKLMGETALLNRDKLENLLGFKLTEKGMIYADENGPRVSIKSFDELDRELQKCEDKFASMLSNGIITEEEYQKYENEIGYIYGYFMSISNGEQIPYRKISDKEIKELQARAEYEGIDFSILLNEINGDMKEEFLSYNENLHKGL